MLTPGSLQTQNGKEQSVAKPLGGELAHVERHYKSIGIGAVSSALSILKKPGEKAGGARELPAFLRKENIAA